MPDEIASVVFEERGYSQVLTGPKDYVDAIESGRITRETRVKVYQPDSTYRTRRAGDVPILKRIFAGEDVLAELEAAIPPEPEAEAAEPAVSLPPELATPANDDVRPSSATSVSLPASEAKPSHPVTVIQAKRPAPRWPWFAGGIAIVFALGYISGRPSLDPASNITENAAAPVPVYKEIGPAGLFYLVRKTNVRDAPSMDGQRVGELHRGDQVRGVRVQNLATGGEFILVNGGPNDGSFVWAPNTSMTAPPTLESTTESVKTLIAQADVHAEPRSDSPVLYTLSSGDTAPVAGRTANGWFEIFRKEGGGVAYVDISAFTRRWYVRNTLDSPIYFWMIPDQVDEGGGESVVEFEIPANARTQLLAPDGRPILSRNPNVSFYARTADSRCEWRTTEGAPANDRSIGGKVLPMRMVPFPQDGSDYMLELTCSE